MNQVVNRWWDEFMSLPWPDKIAFRLVSYMPGKVMRAISKIEVHEEFISILCLRIPSGRTLEELSSDT